MKITCPVCNRPDRSVTKAGRIRDHDSLGGDIGSMERFCRASGLTEDEALLLIKMRENLR